MFRFIEKILVGFRPCFSRRAAFRWFVVVIVGLMLRSDRLGVTSIIRDLALDPSGYESLIHFFRSTAWDAGKIRDKWYRILVSKAPLLRIHGRVVLIGDGVKQSKEGYFIPGVKKMVQESEDSSKPQYIFGHMFGAVGVLAGTLERHFCLPLKINMSGVIPPIFASSILAIPTLVAQFGNSDQSWVKWINANLGNTTSVWYIALYALMIVFFCFFYTSITFNPDETADNMKQYGGFIPGIRAGSATSRYLTYVMNRLNTVGAVYLLFVALIPTVLIMALNLNTKLPFGGTTILIIAGVGLDTLRQAKAQTEQFQYAGFLFENTDHQEGK